MSRVLHFAPVTTDQFRAWMSAAGLGPKDLAYALGVSPASVYIWSRGQRNAPRYIWLAMEAVRPGLWSKVVSASGETVVTLASRRARAQMAMVI